MVTSPFEDVDEAVLKRFKLARDSSVAHVKVKAEELAKKQIC